MWSSPDAYACTEAASTASPEEHSTVLARMLCHPQRCGGEPTRTGSAPVRLRRPNVSTERRHSVPGQPSISDRYAATLPLSGHIDKHPYSRRPLYRRLLDSAHRRSTSRLWRRPAKCPVEPITLPSIPLPVWHLLRRERARDGIIRAHPHCAAVGRQSAEAAFRDGPLTDPLWSKDLTLLHRIVGP